ncbi:hypothetical protein E4U45_000211 [Claviceps purpurea]|nr:hypothetical protein E4U45_000211 [Claviceps purpurea]
MQVCTASKSGKALRQVLKSLRRILILVGSGYADADLISKLEKRGESLSKRHINKAEKSGSSASRRQH